MNDSDKSDKTPSAGTDDWIPAPLADILKTCTASDIPPAWRAWAVTAQDYQENRSSDRSQDDDQSGRDRPVEK